MCKISRDGMNFSKALKELMQENRLTQSVLAESIGVSQRSVSKWLNGQSEPIASNIFVLAKFFDVTSDYLIGLSEI